MNNLINNAINYAYGFNSGGDVGLSELDLIKKKVHEKLDDYKTFASIPPIEEYALYHPKDIKRQEKQNKYYSTL